MNKKIFTIMFAAVLACFGVLGLAACGGSGSSSSSSAAADFDLLEDGVLTICSSPDYPPFESYDKNNNIVGYEVDLINAIADKLDLKTDIKPMQFDAIIPAVVAGGQCDVGMSGFTITPERAQQIDFTDSFYVDDQCVVVLKDSGFTKDNVDEKLNDSSITIACQSGTTGESYAKENYKKATTKGYGNATDSFSALSSGKADAVVTNKAVGDKMVKEFSDAEVVKNIATGEEYGLVISKDNPGLTAAINGALAELKADGTIDQLMDKYFG